MIGKLLKMQLLEDQLAYSPTDEPRVADREIDGQPSWVQAAMLQEF